MPLVVNTNVSSLNAQRSLTTNTNALGKSLERLSSGFRINRAADDAAGLQISETLRAQIRGSKKAQDNVQDGINVLNIADGALNTIGDSLQRIRELAVQAANDTLAATQRTAIKSEIDQLGADITRVSDATQFNGVKLLDGTQAAFNIQVGANSTAANDVIDLTTAVTGVNPFADIDATALGVATGATLVDTNANALLTITALDTAISTVSQRRAAIGALTNRLESTSKNLANSVENLSASESRIRNVDVAAESAELTRNQILQQASASILGQANQSSSLALSLIK
jgi:flagellin